MYLLQFSGTCNTKNTVKIKKTEASKINIIIVLKINSIKIFSRLNSAQHEIFNSRKYKNIKDIQHFQAKISLECFISVHKCKNVGILTFTRRKSFMLS